MPIFNPIIPQSSRAPTALSMDLELPPFPLTSEVLHPQVLWASLLAGERVVQHDFCLCFNPFIELSHCNMAEPLHVLAHFVVRLQLQAALWVTTQVCSSVTPARTALPSTQGESDHTESKMKGIPPL